MKDSLKKVSCWWAYRLDIIGVILIVIATLLTLVTFNGIGIAAMFIAGAGLCAHHCWKNCACHCGRLDCNVCYPQEPEHGSRGKKRSIKDESI